MLAPLGMPCRTVHTAHATGSTTICRMQIRNKGVIPSGALALEYCLMSLDIRNDAKRTMNNPTAIITISRTGRPLAGIAVVVLVVFSVETVVVVVLGSGVVVFWAQTSRNAAATTTISSRIRAIKIPGLLRMNLLSASLVVARDAGYLRVTKRLWFKKGEFKIVRPHGFSENAFRPGDRWGWLSV